MKVSGANGVNWPSHRPQGNCSSNFAVECANTGLVLKCRQVRKSPTRFSARVSYGEGLVAGDVLACCKNESGWLSARRWVRSGCFKKRGGPTRWPPRNDYRTGHLKAAKGDVPYGVPRVRDVETNPIAAIRDRLQGRTETLKQLALEMYARGLLDA